ncbi:MAG TPA: hypothetical protein VGE34_04475 [Candidatus Saccharimonadales bacterium]
MELSQMTIIEAADGDPKKLEQLTRNLVAAGFQSLEPRKKKLVNRAVKYHLKDAADTRLFRPTDEQEDIFISALLTRQFEEIDKLDDSKERQKMLTAVALNIDALRIDDLTQLKAYQNSGLRLKNIHVNWSDAAIEGAKKVREDLGIAEVPRATSRITEEAGLFEPDGTIVEGFTDLRQTIIELLYNNDAHEISSKVAAGLLIGLGLDMPAKGRMTQEEVEVYREDVLRWLAMRLSYAVKNLNGSEGAFIKGRHYLSQIARRYSVQDSISPVEWVATRYEKNEEDYLRHFESHMAFAIHEMFTHPQ